MRITRALDRVETREDAPIPLVDLRAQYATIRLPIDAAIARTIASSSFILGPEVEAFEAAFARYVHATQAVGVASGTAALSLALRACGIGPGDEVVTVSHTFVATAEAISHTGASPVFVDVDPHTYTLAPAAFEAAITPRTRAVVPVHLYGQPADMDPVLEIARSHGLWCIEDAAQAHGAEYKGRRCGSLADLGCFSFYPGKNLGAYGDAGAVTGNDPDLIARVRSLRNHGRTSKYRHDEIGYGERMDAIQAAVLLVKLGYLDAWNAARRSHAASYEALLADCEVQTPFAAPYARHVHHVYAIRTRNRDRMQAHLRAAGIATGVHYPIPAHRQPSYAATHGGAALPVTDAAAAQLLSLPMYPELTAAQVERIAEAVKAAAA